MEGYFINSAVIFSFIELLHKVGLHLLFLTSHRAPRDQDAHVCLFLWSEMPNYVENHEYYTEQMDMQSLGMRQKSRKK